MSTEENPESIMLGEQQEVRFGEDNFHIQVNSDVSDNYGSTESIFASKGTGINTGSNSGSNAGGSVK